MNKIFSWVGELPYGYTYKIFVCEGKIKIIGAAVDKAPIGFFIDEYQTLVKIPTSVNNEPNI